MTYYLVMGGIFASLHAIVAAATWIRRRIRR